MRPIAFCITCKGRAQHVKLTLSQNISDNSDYSEAKFIILDYSSPDDLLPYLFKNHQLEIESGKLVVYSLLEDAPRTFHMAKAKNIAHRLGMREGADILVNLDADNYTGEGFASHINAIFNRHGDDIFLWADMRTFSEGNRPRGISGRIVITAEAFLKSGGYDEKYDTWSPDDKDFNARLRRLGYSAVEIDKKYLDVVRHNDKMRFREYPHVSTSMGEDQFQLSAERCTSVSNFGKSGVGWLRKHPTGETIYVGNFPTRIFGIGMHKTGTTSLHHALKILGFDSAHWQGAHWAKAIWREMNSEGWSETLERHYALCDLPIPLLYEKLDKEYPGSKFILTTRSESYWIDSVWRHWQPEFNRFRSGWDNDPFTNRIHKVLYGRTDFDYKVFLERFRKHNEDVKRYFKDRPDDLLIMDMEAGSGFRELCDFLGRPMVEQSYPRAFVTEGNQ